MQLLEEPDKKAVTREMCPWASYRKDKHQGNIENIAYPGFGDIHREHWQMKSFPEKEP